MEQVQLRPYQKIAIADARMKLGEGLKRIMIYSATGSGKGEIAVALAQFASLRNKKCLFLVHRKDLVKQQWERFQKYGMVTGILQGKNTWKPHSPITVGSIQTLASRKKFGWEFDFDMVIVDEAHLCAGSKHYIELFRSWSNVPIIGLSATPFSKGLGKQHSWGKLFQHMTIVSTIQKLIDDGFLVDCEIYAPSEPDLRGVKVVAGDYHQKQLGDAVDKHELIGDIVKHWFKLAEGKQTIVFATNINHSRHIVGQFKAQGINAAHCDCYMPEGERNDMIDAFKAGKIQVLSNVSLFAEGFDAPATSCMILARPTKSLIRYVQMIGRCLRIHDNLSECYNRYTEDKYGVQRSNAVEDGQEEQSRIKFGVGDELREHAACVQGWIVESGEGGQSWPEQTDRERSGGNKEGTERIQTWVIDATGSKIRSVDNNNFGNKGWKELGACFIAESAKEIDWLVKRLKETHKGDEVILVCTEDQNTGKAKRICGVRRKKIALVLDHSGSVARLGFPTDDLPLELDDGKPNTSEKTENKPKEPKICPKCKYVSAKRFHACPKCGHTPPEKPVTAVEVKDGDLTKIKKMPPEVKQEIYSGLITIAHHRGYQDGWIAYKYKSMTGVWPKGLQRVSGPIPDYVQKKVLADQIRWSKRRKQ